MITALRAWGVLRLGLAAVATVVLIETTATDQLTVPPFSFALDGWCLVPPLAAITQAEPLVDRSPQLASYATRSPITIALLRLSLAAAGTASVIGYCLLSADGGTVARWVLAFVACAAVAVTLLGSWYWLPLLPLAFGWIQYTHGRFPSRDLELSTAVLVAVAGTATAGYVAGTLLRARPVRR